MKIKILSFFLTALLAVSVAGNAQRNMKPDTLATHVSSKSHISAKKLQVEVIKGSCTVFEIQVSNGGDPRIDAQVNTGLIFEIPGDVTEFEISNWKKNQAFVEISNCRCIDLGYSPVVSGSVKVVQLDDGNWEVNADVVAKGKDSGEDRPFQFSGTIPGSNTLQK